MEKIVDALTHRNSCGACYFYSVEMSEEPCNTCLESNEYPKFRLKPSIEMEFIEGKKAIEALKMMKEGK